jgi:hypothetical protein
VCPDDRFAPRDGSAARSSPKSDRSIRTGWPCRSPLTGARSARAAIALDDGAHGRRRHARHVHERHRCRRDAGTVDGTQAGEQRRELARTVLGVDHEPRVRAAARSSAATIVSGS